MLHTMKDVLIYGLNAENATTELCPPNPNEFEIPARVTVLNQAKLVRSHEISNKGVQGVMTEWKTSGSTKDLPTFTSCCCF